MNKSLPGAVLVALTLSATAPAAAAESKQDKDPDKLVCFMEARTGSHMRKRVCMTEAEREARRRSDQEAMQHLRRGQGAAHEGKTGGLN